MPNAKKYRVIAIRADGTQVVVSYGNDLDLARQIVNLLGPGSQYRQVFIEPEDDTEALPPGGAGHSPPLQ
jgi:hypothetical protein